MPPVLALIILVAGLLALLPVWRLRAAAWPSRWLIIAWGGYAVAIFLAIRAPLATRFLVPILVLAFVAPFVAGPDRLRRLVRTPPEPERPIIDVTPRAPIGLPTPPRGAEDEATGTSPAADD